jgi:hypothetical protein
VFVDWLLTESSPSCDTYNDIERVQMYMSSEKRNRVPRWVKLFAVIFATLLALFAFLHLADERFQHGPAAPEAGAGQS